MSILFGHPTGNPNSHQAALAHFEAGRLEAFCVPWMPTPQELEMLHHLPIPSNWTARVERRSFPPLLSAPRCEGRVAEWVRMFKRAVLPNRVSSEVLAWEANDWLMRTMAKECRRRLGVTSVHSYEDCSLKPFQVAKHSGRNCIYDMPIGYYEAWQEIRSQLAKQFSRWFPTRHIQRESDARLEQKREEMKLADLVLVPSSFVERTIRRFHDKKCALAAYGVDSRFWHPSNCTKTDGPVRFLYVGQLSIRKGIPVLLEAWKRADLSEAELHLIGPWLLDMKMRGQLPPGVRYFGACSRNDLLKYYQSADVFVFPSYFEGFALVLLEAMACGLPLIASDATAAPELVDDSIGKIFPAGDVEALADALRLMVAHRERLAEMARAARAKACQLSWDGYRQAVSTAVASFC